MGKPEEKPQTMSSDELHNHNSYAYLSLLKSTISNEIIKVLPILKPILEIDAYQNDYAYGNLYSAAVAAIENEVECIESGLTTTISIDALDPLVIAIYNNDNGIIEDSAWLINSICNEITPLNNPKHIISEQLKDSVPTINTLTPHNSDNLINILSTTYPNFKPLYMGTNIPSLKHYSYKSDTDPIEHRFSTQAQRHNGVVRISPLFKRWLTIKAETEKPKKDISFIYFNNLSLDKSMANIPRFLESQLSTELHQFEKANPDLHIAVITLPSSGGLIELSGYKQTNDALTYAAVHKELLDIALGAPHSSGVTDLHMSDKTKQLLFGSQDPHTVLEPLLSSSFAELGIMPETLLSSAQKQAVWFHFIKYNLTDFIIKTLQPNAYNFSCKDGIDRGAVSSAYYNLIKSFKLNKPLSKEEFDRALHSAAANARGRGMNFHREIIWNALDAYIHGHYDELRQNTEKAWLIYWRDMNCPHERATQLLQLRLIQLEDTLTNLPTEAGKQKELGFEIIKNIRKQTEVSGQRILLEITSRTLELCACPSEKTCTAYNDLADQLIINYPALYIIAGFMKAFLGVLLYLPSLGFTDTMIHQGLATAKAGFFASTKRELSEHMNDFLTEIKPK